VVERDGMLIMVDDDRLPLREGETPKMMDVRFRSLGCYPLSAAAPSQARSVAEIIEELSASKVSERQGRVIDRDEASSMEKKKREGYF
jgi:sulfate adenylyltransferase subunit 2